MKQTLELKFLTSQGKNRTLSIQNPKNQLDEATVRQAMADIQSTALFQNEEGPLYETIVSARYINKEVIDIFQEKA